MKPTGPAWLRETSLSNALYSAECRYYSIDVIIGAPYENSGQGAAYVYLGSSSGLVDRYAQKLVPVGLNLNLGVINFGRSFAAGIDIDANLYPG